MEIGMMWLMWLQTSLRHRPVSKKDIDKTISHKNQPG
jgi:hypothetical protein